MERPGTTNFLSPFILLCMNPLFGGGSNPTNGNARKRGSIRDAKVKQNKTMHEAVWLF
jgi:hypothetical protein